MQSALRDIHAQRLLILDFGSQYTQLIARRVRECGVYCEIYPFDISADDIDAYAPAGVILSGGPETVTEGATPRIPERIFALGVPVLGICYGLQAMAAQLGGEVVASNLREFGHAQIQAEQNSSLLDSVFADADQVSVWMSHGDKVSVLPPDFELMAETDSCPIAGMSHRDKPWFGIQFHPEVTHTLKGEDIFRYFVLSTCGCEALWTPANIVEDAIARVRKQVGDNNVLLGLSGGVDSSVVAALLNRAIGNQLTCVFVDNGLLRLNESDQVMEMFAQSMGVKVIRADAEERFLAKLDGVSDPAAKR